MEKQKINTELTFKEYYDNLERDKKAELKYIFCPKYMKVETFYKKLRDNSWSEYDYEKLESLTGMNFRTNVEIN